MKINILYQKIKEMKEENKVLLNLKNKNNSDEINNNINVLKNDKKKLNELSKNKIFEINNNIF